MTGRIFHINSSIFVVNLINLNILIFLNLKIIFVGKINNWIIICFKILKTICQRVIRNVHSKMLYTKTYQDVIM